MRKLLFILAGLGLLTTFLSGDDYFFRTKKSGVAVQEFDPIAFGYINGFIPVDSTDGWTYLMAYTTGGDTGAILRTRISCTAVQEFTPGSGEINEFTVVDSSDGWSYLIAHITAGDSGWLVRSKTSKTALQEVTCGGGVGFSEFTATDSSDGWCYLGVKCAPLEIEEPEEAVISELPIKVTPNPFSERTRISYSVPEPYQVKISIYDCNGRMVKRLVHKLHKPGRYSIEWDGVDEKGNKVSAGSYFLKFEIGELRTEKTVIVK